MQTDKSSYPYDAEINSLLEQLGNPPTVNAGSGKKELKLCCVLPGHSETIPSLSLNRAKGVFYCYGCGHGGGLKKFADLLGLKFQGEGSSTYVSDEDPFAMMLQGMAEMEDDFTPVQVTPPDMLRDIPPAWNWRGMDGKFLGKLGAKLWFDEKHQVDRVWMPALQNKELVGWFARVKSDEEYAPYRKAIAQLTDQITKIREFIDRRKKEHKKDDKYHIAKDHLKTLLKKRAEVEITVDTIPKYYNNPHMHAKKILFPWDFVRKMARKRGVLVLVEGQVDALVLISRGIPAVAILGTNNWSKFKESLIVSSGVRKVIVAMDGDKPGRKARKVIYEALQGKVPMLEKFRCPEEKGYNDPASMREKYQKRLAMMVAA